MPTTVKQCALCAAAAPTVCANCGTAAYCNKEHQRQHWPEHRLGCFPCSLQRNDQLGRWEARKGEAKRLSGS